MFKIKCYESGLREIYFGKKKIFKIRNSVKELRFILNNISKKIDVLVLDMAESQQSKEGIYHFQYLLRRAHIAGKYYEIFYEFYLQNQNGKKVVFVDCGAHAGVFSDVALACGGVCYAFEPNKYLYAFLRDLYKGNEKLILSNQAVSNKNGKTTFYTYASNAVSDGAGIMRNNLGVGYEVEMLDFCEFLKDIIQKHHKLASLKLILKGRNLMCWIL